MSSTEISNKSVTISALKEVLPKTGLVYTEKVQRTELLCKPKILPIKSLTLEKIEAMQKAASELRFDANERSNESDLAKDIERTVQAAMPRSPSELGV